MALGAGAWQARRERRSRVGELFASTPRLRWQRVAPTAVGMAVAAIAGYLGMFAASAVRVAPTATYFPLGSVPVVAVGALAMVAGVWLGLAIGRALPSAFTPPALVVASLMALILPMMTLDPTAHGAESGTNRLAVLLLSPALSRPDGDFVTVSSRVHLGQAVWFAALAAAAFVILGATRWRERLAAVAPAAAAAVLAVAIFPATDTVPDPAARRLVCTSDAPKVCVTKVHASGLDDLRGPARKALAILAAKLPQAPTSVAESPTSWIAENSRSQPPETLLVELTVDANGRPEPSFLPLQWELLDGAGTRRCANTANTYVDARLVAAAWLMDQAPPWEPAGGARKLWEQLRRLPAAEQRARVAALRKAALACEERDLAAILTGAGAAR
jgi:hypothetical protein